MWLEEAQCSDGGPLRKPPEIYSLKFSNNHSTSSVRVILLCICEIELQLSPSYPTHVMAARQPSEETPPQPTKLSPVTAAHPPTLHSPSSARSPPTSSHGLRPPPSPKMEGHRRSFAENLRTNPSSPRAQRHNSFSERTLQELLTNPPIAKNGPSQFQGRDWRSIEIGEIIDPEHVRFVDMDMSVEQATKVADLSFVGKDGDILTTWTGFSTSRPSKRRPPSRVSYLPQSHRHLRLRRPHSVSSPGHWPCAS